MLECIAIDDEPLALDLLEDNIRSLPFLNLNARCRNANEAIQAMQEKAVDLVFSDIQMPGLNGLQLIRALKARPMFILITAHDKFAVESYDLEVIDYLLKPVAYERFVKACTKAQDHNSMRETGALNAAKNETKEFLFLPADYQMVKIALADINVIEGVKDYVRICFNTAARPLLVRISMKAIKEMLPASGFLRIHKSYIVNIRHITAIRKNSLFIGTLELPVGELHREAITRLTEGKY